MDRRSSALRGRRPGHGLALAEVANLGERDAQAAIAAAARAWPAWRANTVTARTDIGCIASDDIRIKVYKGPDIYVPNAFTPDGNGVNDILRAIPVGIKDFRYFRIYNRWGTLIFTTNTSLTGWDGTIKGNQQSAGTYVWMAEGVDYKGNIVQRKGTVTIIK